MELLPAFALAGALAVALRVLRRHRPCPRHRRDGLAARFGAGYPLAISRDGDADGGGYDGDGQLEESAFDADDEELELQEGALDPDELQGDPLYWDEGADDEVG